MFQDRSIDGKVSTTATLTNMLPLFGIDLIPSTIGSPEASRMNLLSHFLTTGHGITFGSCDTYGISVLNCQAPSLQRPIIPAFNYLLYRGLMLNKMEGWASFLTNQTVELICESKMPGFYDSYDARAATPLGLFNSSTLSAASMINMILPPCKLLKERKSISLMRF